MKTKLHVTTFGLLIIFFSCGQPNDKKNTSLTTPDSLLTSLDKNEKERLGKKEIEENDNLDSLMLDKVLKEALTISVQNIDKVKFQKEYDARPTDEYNIKVEIKVDYQFSKHYSHLIIRRYDPNSVYIDIYTKNGNNYEKVLSHEQWNLEYMNDTIRDINGDGYNDFVVNWYGSNGCCLKAFSNVYLLRPNKRTFSDKFEFINPTFSPKEKIIRGVGYGHPSETEMYKYKWNGEKVDTLEYVSYQKNDNGKKTGKVVISTDQPFSDKNKILKISNSVPIEYRKIEGYDWFTGNGYE